MSFRKETGRQEVIGAKQTINYTDVATAGELDAMNLPSGAIITAGYFYNNLTGPTDYTITVEDKDGTVLMADFAGAFAAGRVDVAPTGVLLTKPSFVKVTTVGDATAGDAYLYLEYIVDGRAAFSEG